jgi:hypothetical protein
VRLFPFSRPLYDLPLRGSWRAPRISVNRLRKI